MKYIIYITVLPPWQHPVAAIMVAADEELSVDGFLLIS
jgi:hypothetical protein